MYYGDLGIPICPLFLFSKAPFHDTGNYKDEALTLTEVSQLIWAAQGITHPGICWSMNRRPGSMVRGVRDVHMEVGHAAQNVYLQAVSLGLGLWL